MLLFYWCNSQCWYAQFSTFEPSANYWGCCSRPHSHSSATRFGVVTPGAQRGGAIPRAPSHYGDGKWLRGRCGGRQKVPTTSQVLRASLKPMQPMRLHWAPRLWGPAPWSLGRLFIFVRYSLGSRIQQKRLITLLANNVLIWTKSEFPLINLIEGYQTCSILMLEPYICAPPCPTLNGWNVFLNNAS